jgi:hypothetical protein
MSPTVHACFSSWLNSVNRGHFANAVTKVDMESGETIAWRGDTFSHPSEAIFIPNPNAASEDDGLIVSSVTDVRDDVDDFLVPILWISISDENFFRTNLFRTKISDKFFSTKIYKKMIDFRHLVALKSQLLMEYDTRRHRTSVDSLHLL